MHADTFGQNFVEVTEASVGRNSVVGIATYYGLNGPGIESRWGRDFPLPPRPALGLTNPPLWWVPGLFLGGKAVGAWHWPPTPSGAEVQERVELYLYSSFGTSRSFLEGTSAFTLNSSKSMADGKESGRGFPVSVCCSIPMRRLWSLSTFMWTEWVERKA